jgi:hypothetical protein
MRIGFVTRLLWDRYGPFWRRLLDAADAETITADAERVAELEADPRLDVVAGRAFREAAAQALALSGCERIVVPELNPGYAGSRGSAQDPFVADFPGALAQAVPGLPGLLPVPADLADDAVEGRAVALLSLANPSPGTVRRVWQTHRADARPPRLPSLPSAGGSARRTIALVGQPWHLRPGVEEQAGRGGERVLCAARIEPADARAEGWRIDPKLAPSDAEALGAIRRLVRRPGVDAIRMVVDRSSGADAWLERRARELAARRPFETIDLDDLDDLTTVRRGDGTAAG